MSDELSAPISTFDFDLDKEADRTVPGGVYTVEVENIKQEFTDSETPVAQYNIRLRILDEEITPDDGVPVEVKGKTIFDNIQLTKKMAWKLNPFIKATGISYSVEDGKTVVNHQEALNRQIRVVVSRDAIIRDEVVTDEYRNNIKRYLPLESAA